MRGKYLTALAAVTAVIALAAIIATRTQAPSGPEVGLGEAIYPGLAAKLNAVEKFTVARKEGNFTLVRKGDDWTAMEKSGYPADFAKIRRTMLEIADLKKLEAKTKAEIGASVRAGQPLNDRQMEQLNRDLPDVQ